MKFSLPYKRLFILSLIGGLVSAPLLTSCGSSGDGTTAGIGGTGITQGEITAFGSIFVNGVKFNTDSSEFEVDGNIEPGQNNLSTGMIVTIKGTVNDDGVTGIAESVEYDDQIQGPISSITAFGDSQKTLTIFNKSVLIDETSTTYQGTSFAEIVTGNFVEISGFNASATDITATFIRKTDNNEIELKGEITDLDLTNSTFKLVGTAAAINFDSSTVFELSGGILTNGLFVEVKGNLEPTDTITAREVELEEADFEDGSEVSLQGVVTNFVDNTNFTLGSQSVVVNDVSILPANGISVGNNIEVGGVIINGTLIANEVELRDGSVEIKASITNIDRTNNRIEFDFQTADGPISVSVNNRTRFEDDVFSISTFSLADINLGNFVKIKGFENNGEIIASRVKRLQTLSSAEDVEIQGKVSDVTRDLSNSITSITLLGLTFIFDGNESYEPETLPSIISPGIIIELTDNFPANGTIDKVEID